MYMYVTYILCNLVAMQPVLVIQYSSVDEGDNYEGSRSESTYCRKASSCAEKFGSQILSASFMFYVGKYSARTNITLPEKSRSSCYTKLPTAQDMHAMATYLWFKQWLCMKWPSWLHADEPPADVTFEMQLYRQGQATSWCYLQDETIQKSQATSWCYLYLQDATIQTRSSHLTVPFTS